MSDRKKIGILQCRTNNTCYVIECNNQMCKCVVNIFKSFAGTPSIFKYWNGKIETEPELRRNDRNNLQAYTRINTYTNAYSPEYSRIKYAMSNYSSWMIIIILVVQTYTNVFTFTFFVHFNYRPATEIALTVCAHWSNRDAHCTC